MLAAIVAHYDPDAQWSDGFLVLLDILCEHNDDVTVVTTAEEIGDLPACCGSVHLIRRPNIGYDFYSYRVGVSSLLQRASPDGILLVNSSFVVVNRQRFSDLICDLISKGKSTVRGVTSSCQISWHIQSYLMFLNMRSPGSDNIVEFLSKVEPTNSKFETILRYEIGLGRLLSEKNISSETRFSPSLRTRMQALRSKLDSLANERDEVRGLARLKKAWKEINWTHFGVAQLAQDFGVVKVETIRDNPHLVDLSTISTQSDDSGRKNLTSFIERTKRHYVRGESNLVELRSQDETLIVKILKIRPKVSTFAKVAVVLHAYHIDLLEEALGYTDNILEPFRLFVTTPFEADIPVIIRAASKRNLSLTIALTKNNGFDVGPFISLYRTGELDSFDAVLKLHTKKSSYSTKGPFWRQHLLKLLCGDSLTVFRALNLIRKNGCGQVGPEPYFLTRSEFMGANYNNLIEIINSCAPELREEDIKLSFFAGTMFWFSPDALKSLKYCSSQLVDFDVSSSQQDGTLAHAWERAFSLLVWSAGYKVSSVGLMGDDIGGMTNDYKTVPVL